jgi:hypothetical protein
MRGVEIRIKMLSSVSLSRDALCHELKVLKRFTESCLVIRQPTEATYGFRIAHSTLRHCMEIVGALNFQKA